MKAFLIKLFSQHLNTAQNWKKKNFLGNGSLKKRANTERDRERGRERENNTYTWVLISHIKCTYEVQGSIDNIEVNKCLR